MLSGALQELDTLEFDQSGSTAILADCRSWLGERLAKAKQFRRTCSALKKTNIFVLIACPSAFLKTRHRQVTQIRRHNLLRLS